MGRSSNTGGAATCVVEAALSLASQGIPLRAGWRPYDAGPGRTAALIGRYDALGEPEPGSQARAVSRRANRRARSLVRRACAKLAREWWLVEPWWLPGDVAALSPAMCWHVARRLALELGEVCARLHARRIAPGPALDEGRDLVRAAILRLHPGVQFARRHWWRTSLEPEVELTRLKVTAKALADDLAGVLGQRHTVPATIHHTGVAALSAGLWRGGDRPAADLWHSCEPHRGGQVAIAAPGCPTRPLAPHYILRAVVVGINAYENAQCHQAAALRYARADAEAVAQMLAHTATCSVATLDLLLDDDATAAAIRRRLVTAFSSQRSGQNEIALFYFAGHGLCNPYDDRVCLAGYDVDFGDPNQGGIRLSDIYALLERTSAACAIAIIDACFSGGIIQGTAGEPLSAAEQAQRAFSALSGPDGKTRAVLAACRMDQTAREDPCLEHGIYTYELLRGWRDGRARGADGAVTLLGLADYLTRRFEHDPQVPQVAVRADRAITLRRGPSRRALYVLRDHEC